MTNKCSEKKDRERDMHRKSMQQDRGGAGRGRDGGRGRTDQGRGKGRFVMPTGQAFFTGGISSSAAAGNVTS